MKQKTEAQAFAEVQRDFPVTEYLNRCFEARQRVNERHRVVSTGALLPGTCPGRKW